MDNKIKDLTREFSEIENNIIIEFSNKLSVERLDRTTSSFGKSTYWLYSGITCIEIALHCSEGVREILVSSKNIREGRHELNTGQIKNPSELSTYLNSLAQQILITE